MLHQQKPPPTLDGEQYNFLTLNPFQEVVRENSSHQNLMSCTSPALVDFSFLASENIQVLPYSHLNYSANNNNKENQLLSNFPSKKNSIDFFDLYQLPQQNEDHDNDINQFEDENLEKLYYQYSEPYQPQFSMNFTLETSQNQKKNKQISKRQENLLVFQEEEEEEQEEEFLNNSSSSNLHPIQELDFEEPFMAFEFPDFNLASMKDNQISFNPNQKVAQKDEKQNTVQQVENNLPSQQVKQIWKVTQKIQKQKKQRDYDKNICRYLARCIIRCFVDKIYHSEVQNYCNQFSNNKEDSKNLYNSSIQFFLSKIEFVTGHRAFRELLCFNDENETKKLEKQVFRAFTYWFLKERAFRYIMTGAMTDKQSYLKFKNEIMLLYVNRPDSWTSNIKSEKSRRLQ